MISSVRAHDFIRAQRAAQGSETSRFTAMSPEQRLELFLELCDLTDSIVNARPDAFSLRAPHPRSTEAEALWRDLMRRARRDPPR